MYQRRNSGIGCFIGLIMMILFGVFFFFGFNRIFFIFPIFPVIIVFVIFIGITVAASQGSRQNRRKPENYYYQQNYNHTNPYMVKTSTVSISQPTLIKSNNASSNIKPQSGYCRECGASITQGASFCQNCGTRLNKPEINYSRQIEIIEEKTREEKVIDKSFCPYCGTRTDKDSMYCFHCGTKLV